MRRIIFYLAILLFIVACNSDPKIDLDTTEYSKGIKSGSFTDSRDNETYRWVKIGNQVWMAENLRATVYNDGTSIPNETENLKWKSMTTGAYCYYMNESSYKAIYGCLYNWYAVNTSKLAPRGWHVPTTSEWETLQRFLGCRDLAGGKLKSTSGWRFPNIGADNSSGFSALPGGGRSGYAGEFFKAGENGNWWTSTDRGAGYQYTDHIGLNYNDRVFYGSGYSDGLKRNGHSVRCVKDY